MGTNQAGKLDTASTELITIRDIEKIYQADSDEESVHALHDVDLTIGDHEFVSLVGPSGCGKTTLLRLVSGLTESTDGQIEINGNVVNGPVPEVGFVFQSPVLMDWRTVHMNVMFPFEALKSGNDPLELSEAEAEERAHELLEMVGLEDFTESYPKQLSGGMQQRVAICRALLPDPPILLMDEPFGALDEFTRDKLNRQLLDIWQETQKTVLFVTHNVQESVYLSDRVVVLSERPGEIKTIVDIDIDRPRPLDVRDTPEFIENVADVREAIGIYEE